MNILIENHQTNIEVSKENLTLIKTAALNCFKLLSFPLKTEINIMLYNNIMIKTLNKEQRNIDKATDVLSFPMTHMENGDLTTIDQNIDILDNVLFLGDIVISLEKTISQANEFNHSFERELAFLTTHGVFHLLGYDHLIDEDEKEMFSLQEKVLALMKLDRK